MYDIMNLRADAMAEPWKRIDTIAKTQFKRRVLRAFRDYKFRKAEKARKKREKAAKGKGKKKKKKRRPALLPPGASIDMADGMTNINLANTGDGEIPEAGEDGEEGEGDEGDEGEKAEGEEGEEADKGPKLTPEQSEELKKAFEEKHPDSEGLLTKEDLIPLFQALGEDMTEEIIGEFMKSAEEDEETQKITFVDFLKAISPAPQEDGEKPEGEEGSDKKTSEKGGELKQDGEGTPKQDGKKDETPGED